jgi:hypothetical protein
MTSDKETLNRLKDAIKRQDFEVCQGNNTAAIMAWEEVLNIVYDKEEPRYVTKLGLYGTYIYDREKERELTVEDTLNLLNGEKK